MNINACNNRRRAVPPLRSPFFRPRALWLMAVVVGSAVSSPAAEKTKAAADVPSAKVEVKAAEARLAALQATAPADGAVKQADVLEARVDVRLARNRLQEAKAAEGADSAEVAATKLSLFNEVRNAKTPPARREAIARLAEFQRMVDESKADTRATQTAATGVKTGND